MSRPSKRRDDAMGDRLELYGDRTGNCLRVAIALEEARLPYVARRVDLNGRAHFDQSFLSLNPLGKVPVLIDRRGPEPLVLTQSNAIMVYVASLAPGKLSPLSDARALARCNERFFFFITDVIAPSHAGFRLQAYGSDAAAALLNQQALGMLQAAEGFLAEDRYMNGANFGAADIAAYTIARTFRNHLDWANAPRLAEWMERVGERPAVQRGLAVFDPAAIDP